MIPENNQPPPTDRGDAPEAMQPEQFVASAKALLTLLSKAFYGDAGKWSEVDHSAAEVQQEALLVLGDFALKAVRLNGEDQKLATEIVRIIRSSGDTPERLWNLPKAEAVASSYYAIQEQLGRNPRSPLLSVFANGPLDEHRGITVQAAYATGGVYWRTDPFRQGGGEPEFAVETHENVGLHLSRSRQRAVRDTKRRRLDPDVLNCSDDELLIVGDHTCLVLTDDNDPLHLLPAQSEKNPELGPALKSEANQQSTHWLAVGEDAVDRLIMRFEHEVGPLLKSTKAGVLEERRIRHQMNEALAILDGQGCATTVPPYRSITCDIETALCDELIIFLSQKSFTTERQRSDSLVSTYGWVLSDLRSDQIVTGVARSIAAQHEDGRIAYGELHAAIEEQVAATFTQALLLR